MHRCEVCGKRCDCLAGYDPLEPYAHECTNPLCGEESFADYCEREGRD